jgi:hypothetical protein
MPTNMLDDAGGRRGLTSPREGLGDVSCAEHSTAARWHRARSAPACCSNTKVMVLSRRLPTVARDRLTDYASPF